MSSAVTQYPLSLAQRDIWFDESVPPDCGVYTIGAYTEFTGELNVSALREAIRISVCETDVLRMVLTEVDGEVRQSFPEVSEVQIGWYDFSKDAHPMESALAEIHKWLNLPFRLFEEPLYRYAIYRISERRHLFMYFYHHLALDGWGTWLVIQRQAELYISLSQGLPPPPREKVSYPPLLPNEESYLKSESFARQRDYWQRKYATLPEPLLSPKRPPSPVGEGMPGSSHTWMFSRSKFDQLSTLAKANGFSVFHLLIGVLYVYFTRTQDRDEFVIGLPILNRGTAAFRRTPGLFVNVLPARLTFGLELDFFSLAKAIARVLREDYRHQRFPLSEIYRSTGVVEQGRTRLYDVLLSFESASYTLDLGNGLHGTTHAELNSYEQDPLSIYIRDFGPTTDVQVDFSYNLAFFDHDDAVLLEKRLRLLLEELLTPSDSPIARINLLPDEERRQLLVDWNATPTPKPRGLVHELFEAQVARDPKAMALIFEEHRLSYAELNTRANQLAHHLIALGIGPDVLVAIALERSPEMIIALLATLKAGGAYVPLDPDYPAERLAFMLADCKARVLITQQSLLGKLPAELPKVICLDDLNVSLDALTDSNPQPRALPQHLAYVIYTSGSTGQPKGVLVEHRGLSNLAQAQIAEFQTGPGSKVLQFASFSFDASLSEVVMALCSGAELHLPNSEQRMPGPGLIEHLRSTAITHLTLSPSALAVLPVEPLPDLRHLIVAGEACPPSLAKVWVEGRRFYNAYGPTEATVCATIGLYSDIRDQDLLPIGRPIASTRLYVLDRHGQPVPIGVPGELYIGGLGVARGYLKRPELTAERFLPDPFTQTADARMYRTGDLVRYRSDGNLEFLGRLDHQVKIRGFRIELGEIESVLLSHSSIKECVVLARKTQNGDMRLLAYLVASAGPVDASELRTFLKAKLPDYMVPAAFVWLEDFPLTPNGKLDRKALPEPGEDAGARTRVAPRNELEEIVCGLWAEVLGRENVGIEDNFFELGGHSLLATQLCSLLCEVLGHSVPVRWVFEVPTVSSLCERLRPLLQGEGKEESCVPPNLIPPGADCITPEMLPLVSLTQQEIDTVVSSVEGGASNVQDIYPLAPTQEGILFHHELQREGDAYQSYALLSFDSDANCDAYLSALQHVVDRHDLLRTGFVRDGLSQPVQVVWRKARLRLSDESFDPALGPVSEQLIEKHHPRHNKIDLRKAPLLRLVRTQDTDRTLLLLLPHHLVIDHTTLEVMAAEIEAFIQGRTHLLPTPIPFRSFITQFRNERNNREHEAFFKQLLGDIDFPTAPFGLLDVHGDGDRLREAQTLLPRELAVRLRAAARRHGATPAGMCHLAWGLLLSRCCNQDDVVFGTVLFGRMQGGHGVERAVGMFINTLPMRISLGSRPLTEALLDTQRTLLALMRHESSPLSLAQQCSAVSFPIPLFSTLFNYRHSLPGNMSEVPAAPGLTVLQTQEFSNYSFGMSVDDLGCDLGLTAHVDLSVQPQRICALMQRCLESLVSALENAPLTPLCRLDVLPSKERRQLLVDWNTTPGPKPRGLVHELFEAQVARAPEATALVFEERRLSYAELNARANQLAHHLISLGVGPDRLVAIALERSPEMIIALLATLKAGGAYVPLDPDYPAKRLAFMLADSEAGVLITQESLLGKLPPELPRLLCLDTQHALLDSLPDSNPPPRALPQHLAYVIYTSGSTGQPKGVLIEHASIAAHCLVIQERYKLGAGDLLYHFFSFSFDASVEDILAPLSSGAGLVAKRNGTLTAEELDEAIERHKVTVLHLPPVFFQQWLEISRETPPRAKLKLVNVGGDVMTRRMVELWQESPWKLLHGTKLINGYGPTEATVHSSMYDVLDSLPSESVPIGRPLPGRMLYVLDRHGEPVPIGVPGELYIGGAGVARGYLKRPELTAERFLPDPFSQVPGSRLYRTGDLVRYLPDGNLEFLGRLDHQVKIRGFRIELGEIESVLLSHRSVKECVVLARTSKHGDSSLVAYLVASAQPLNSGELRSFLKAKLPEYMVPAAFVWLEDFPLTPNGKLDRKALPEPGEDAGARTRAVPRNELEEIVCGLWAEVLGRENVGIEDNFFELGGHSLLATRLCSRLCEVLGHSVPVRWVFEVPTVSSLSDRLRPLLQGEEYEQRQAPPNLIPPGADSITPEMLPLVSLTQQEIDTVAASVEGGVSNVQDIYPLAPTQEGILFHHELQREGDAYLSYALLAFDSGANCDAYLSALQQVVDRHDILRTGFVRDGLSQPVQVVWRKASLHLSDESFDPALGPVSEQLTEKHHPRHTRIDLQQAPLLRLVRTQEGGRTLLLFLSHHLIFDHTTLEVLTDEIAECIQGRTDRLSPPIPFRGFIAQARNEANNREQEAFFRQLLGDIDSPTAPFGLLDVHGSGERLRDAHTLLPRELSVRLRTSARRHGATPAALCHLAWSLLLSRCCNQDDVVFGTVLFGRMQGGHGVERALGMFINTLPLRITLGSRPLKDALLDTQRTLLALMRHEHTPLSLAQRCSAVPSPTPVFSTLFNYRHSLPENASETPAVPGLTVLQSQELTNYSFGMSVDDLGCDLGLTAHVDFSVQPERICAFMQRCLESLVSALENAPLTPLCRLDMLPSEERRQLLFDWNTTTRPEPRSLVHELFEAQVARAPEATALVFEERRLCYAELNARANQLAHHLISLGVGPDRLVAIALERSPEMIIALLATLKAGGAYVPLDPDYPAKRLAFMLADSEAGVLITQESLLGKLPSELPKVLCLDTQNALLDSLPDSNPPPRALPQHLAYVIYTSGSTGQPKGVLIEHASIAAHCLNISAHYSLCPEDRVLQFASFSFDTSIEQILPPLLSGACVVLPPSQLMQPEEIDECLRHHRVSVLDLPPALFPPWATFSAPSLPPTLRLIVFGGESLPADALSHRSAWRQPWPRLINAYGPTEATITAVSFSIPNDFAGTIPPIGRPLPGRTLYVLDRHGEPVPIGVPGELYIGGAGIARGYLKRPELTAERFLPDPFSHIPGARLYRTGDLVRYLPDGNLEFLGRLDHQVKIRGFRIEPGEIESVLLKRADIKEAVVVGDEATPLSAFVVLRDSNSASEWQGTQLITVAQRPSLEMSMEIEHASAWPKFFAGDKTQSRLWKAIYKSFPELQFAILRDSQVVAAGNMIPLYWDGQTESLPEGWDQALEMAFSKPESGRRPNTVCVMAGLVTPAMKGRNLSYLIVTTMAKLAKRHGYEHAIYPVRPNRKSQHPDLPLCDYASLRNAADELPVDPWLRVHHRLGGRILRLSERSQKVEGSIEDWRNWTGLDFPESGDYVVEGALQRVHIDHSTNTGLYYDQAIWVEHDLAKHEDDLPGCATPRELRRYMETRLPSYMVPARIEIIGRIPLTPNGKLDRKALPEPGEGAGGRVVVAARDEVEEIVCGLWAEVLGRENVGIEDNFFELGGHSLLATQLCSRLREALGHSVPIRWVFEVPTVSSLCDRLRPLLQGEECEQRQVPPNLIPPGADSITPEMLPLVSLTQQEIDSVAASVEGGASNVQDIYPLAPTQEGILFHHELQREGDAYLSYVLLAFDSGANCDSYLSALQQVVDRHDILRTGFVRDGLSQPVQVVWRKARLHLSDESFDPALGPVSEQLIEKYHPRHNKIDLQQAPLLRLVRTQEGGRTLLLLLSHHLISDHTTLEVMTVEIAAFIQGRTQLLSTPIPFRGFIAQFRNERNNREHEAFFKQLLGDIDFPTAPFGLLDVHGGGDRLREAHTLLPRELSLRLRAAARRHGATPAGICHLAWSLLLSRCCNQDDVVFGTVLFGRMQGGHGVERALGMFINTLPIRISLGSRPLTEALLDTQRTLLALIRHESSPLSLAQRCSAVASPTPLFSSLFNYRHSLPENSSATPVIPGLTMLQAQELTNYPLGMSVDDLGCDLDLTAHVDLSVQPERICTYMQRCLESLVMALEQAPLTPLSKIDVLPETERRQLLVDWNETPGPEPRELVHELFEAQVLRAPEATALVFEKRSLSYAELNVQANQLAHHLISLGIGPDVPVAIALERSPEMIIAMLATLKAGGAYVPLDLDYPEDRLAFMFADSEAKVLLTQKALLGKLPAELPKVLCIDELRTDLDVLPDSNPQQRVLPHHLAYTTYTSGSTGRPKGVLIEHRGLSNFVVAQNTEVETGPGSRVLQFAALSFDVSISEVSMALCAGAALYLPNSEQRMPGPGLVQYLRSSAITHLSLTPSALAVLPVEPLPDLKHFISVGEACPPSLAKVWGEGRHFHNAYGPTEITVYATFALCSNLDGHTPLPLGRRIANSRLYVLDRHGEPVPFGVPGELYIGGIGVARGYLKRPELTAERFLPDPFSQTPGARMYRSGDLVRYLPDGTLEILGRLDHQVKIRGFRIELGEIESVLLSHGSVKKCVVLARKTQNGDNRLIAYMVASEQPIDAAELRSFLKAKLPEYMVPAAFVWLEAFPLSPNGKLDRKALPEPAEETSQHGYLAPRDAVERRLTEIWQSLLNNSALGIRDNFFEKGGHSLLAMRMASDIQTQLGVRIPVARLFEHPTIEGVASLLRQGGAAHKPSCLVTLRSSGNREPLFLLPGLLGVVWYFHALLPYQHQDIPVYAFQTKGTEADEEPHDSIEEMATHYVDLMRSVQPKGPYHLAGHSAGALVAFEMAQMLVSQGEKIGQLVIIDTPAPSVSSMEAELEETEMELLYDIVEILTEISGKTAVAPLQRDTETSFEEALHQSALRLEQVDQLPRGTGIKYLRALFKVLKHGMQIQDLYKPSRIAPLPITLIRAKELHVEGSDASVIGEDYGWSKFSSQGLTVHEVPGNHLTMMMEPHVSTVASILNQILIRSEEPRPRNLSR